MGTTTVHLPRPLLEGVDARAQAEGVSRNRVIILALERFLRERESWSPEFLAELRERPGSRDIKAIDEMLRAISRRRSRKRAPNL